MEFNRIKFHILKIFYYILNLCILSIFCIDSEFKLQGKIDLYNNTIVKKICCQNNCINYPLISDINDGLFDFNLNDLDLTLEITIQNKEYIPGSIIAANISSIVKSSNYTCGNPTLISLSVYLNENRSNYVGIRNYSQLFKIPKDIRGNYSLIYKYKLQEKFTCNSGSKFIKANSSDSFCLSDLVTLSGKVEDKCCDNYNITISKVDPGFSFEENEGIVLNEAFKSSFIKENNKKINFKYNQTGCYHFEYYLNQENYIKKDTCSRKYIICYKTCETCKGCDPTKDDHQCNVCMPGYYKRVGGNDNCYTEEEKKINFPNYFLDTSLKMFDRCYDSCGTCRIKGNKYKHKCDTCAENYYKTEGNEYLSNCYKESNKPNNYFFDENKKLFVKCSQTCGECTSRGDRYSNNCTTCLNYHHFYLEEPGNCIMEGTQPINYYLEEKNNSYQKCFETCKTCSQYKDDNSQNCLSCEEEKGYYLIFDQPGNCVSNNPGPNYYLNPINQEESQFEKCNINFCIECEENEWYYVSRYLGSSFYCENHRDGDIFNMQIYKKSEPLYNKTQSFINDLDILNCENILKNKSIMSKIEEIIVVKKDFINSTNNEINKIEYLFYKKNKKSDSLALSTLLNISACDNLDFLITIPRNLSNYYSNDYIKELKIAFDRFGYDLFNIKDPFYSDMCLPFFMNEGDLTLKDRASLYLPNYLCPDNCIYNSMKFRNEEYFSDVNCICNKLFKYNVSDYFIILSNNSFIKNNATNIGILKCFNSFKNAFKFEYFNCSFVFYIIIFIVYLYFLFSYFFIDKHKFRANIFESLRKSHSAYCKLEKNDPTIFNERLESYYNNKYVSFDTKILSLNISDNTNINNMPYNYSKYYDDREFIRMFYSILMDIDFIFRIFVKKDEYKILSLSINIFLGHINLMLILNTIFVYDNIISYKFLYDRIPMQKIVINVLILICIQFALFKFVYKKLFVSEKLMDFLIEEYKNESFYFSRIQDFIIYKHKKIIALFIINFVFLLFGFYYNITFGYIFIKSQIIWIEQIIICAFLVLLINAIFSLIIAGLRILSIKYKNLYIYNASLILKGILSQDI